MNVKQLLSLKGWRKKSGCPTCGGGDKWITYLNNDKPTEKVEINTARGLFRYQRDGVRRSGGTLQSLSFQHFMQ